MRFLIVIIMCCSFSLTSLASDVNQKRMNGIPDSLTSNNSNSLDNGYKCHAENALLAHQDTKKTSDDKVVKSPLVKKLQPIVRNYSQVSF